MQPVLSKAWRLSNQFQTLYSGGSVAWCDVPITDAPAAEAAVEEHTHVRSALFALCDLGVNVIDPHSSRVLASFGRPDDDCRIGSAAGGDSAVQHNSPDDNSLLLDDAYVLTKDEVATFGVCSRGAVVVTLSRSSQMLRGWRVKWTLEAAADPSTSEVKHEDPIEAQSAGVSHRHLAVSAIEVLRSFPKSNSYVRCLAVSPSGQSVAVGYVDGAVKVFDVDGGFCTHSFPKFQDTCCTLKFHPHLNLLAAASASGEVVLYDLIRATAVVRCADHMSAISQMAFFSTSTSGSTHEASAEPLGGLVTVSRDKIMNVWDLGGANIRISAKLHDFFAQTFQSRRVRREESVAIGSALSTDEEFTAGRINNSAKLKRALGFAATEKLKGVEAFASIYCVDIKPLQQIPTHEVVEDFVCLPSSAISISVAAKLPCPWVIATVGELSKLRIWNPIKRTCIAEIATPHCSSSAILYLLAFNHRQQTPTTTSTPAAASPLQLVSIGADCLVVLWSLQPVKPLRVLAAQSNDTVRCAIVPVGKRHRSTVGGLNGDDVAPVVKRRLLISRDATPRLLEIRQDAGQDWVLLHGHKVEVVSCAVAPEGCWIATGCKQGTIRIWSAHTGRCVKSLSGHTGMVCALNFQYKRPTHVDCTCLLPEGCEPIIEHSPVLTSKKSRKRAAAASPAAVTMPGEGVLPHNHNQLLLASCGADQLLKVWVLQRNELMRLSYLQGATESDCAPSSNAVVPIEGGTAAVSDASLTAHNKDINCLAVAPNDRFIATGSADKTVKIWKLSHGKYGWALSHVGSCTGHRRPVWALKFSHVEQIIASGSADATVRLWNLKDFMCLKTFEGHSRTVVDMAFLPAGTQLLTASSDATIKLWNIRTSDCASTLSAHNESVASLDINAREVTDLSELEMVSCSAADGSVFEWRDCTAEEVSKKLQERRDLVLHDAKIDAKIREGSTRECLELVLNMNRPVQMRKLLTDHYADIVNNQIKRNHLQGSMRSDGDAPDSVAVVDGLDSVVGDWLKSLCSDDRPLSDLTALLGYLVKWITNTKTAWLSVALLKQILLHISPERLTSVPGFPSLCSSFVEYAQRHQDRRLTLFEKSFLLDFVLSTVGKNPMRCDLGVHTDVGTQVH